MVLAPHVAQSVVVRRVHETECRCRSRRLLLVLHPMCGVGREFGHGKAGGQTERGRQRTGYRTLVRCRRPARGRPPTALTRIRSVQLAVLQRYHRQFRALETHGLLLLFRR